MKKLSKNKWIKNITNKGITYTNDFKYKLVKECENYKKFPQDVFRECGIEPEIVGIRRIESSAHRWRIQLNSIGEIKDTRKGASGRPLEHELSDKEKLERAETRIKLLEAENELLKKRNDRNGNFNRYQINIKIETIKYVIDKYDLKGMVSYLCECIGVSKSGYYNYLKNKYKRIERDNKDQKDFELILKAYKFKKRKKGARQIMMVLDNEFNVHFYLKKSED